MAGPMMQAAAERLATELGEHDTGNRDWLYLVATLAGASVELAARATAGLAGGRSVDLMMDESDIQLHGSAVTALANVTFNHSSLVLNELMPPKFDGTWVDLPHHANRPRIEDEADFIAWLAERTNFMLLAEFDKQETQHG